MPARFRTKINPSGRKRARTKKKTKDIKITLPEPLKVNINQWAEDKSTFWDAGHSEEQPPTLDCPLAAAYQGLTKAQIRTAGDLVRLRLLKVLFHHLKDRFCVTYLRSQPLEWMTSRIVAAGLEDDASIIMDNIKDWATLGGRYDALCMDLGDDDAAESYQYLGNLFRLPEDITDR